MKKFVKVMKVINNSRGLLSATPHLNNNELIRSPLMSKIYIDPLNLGPVLIDTDDKSDHEQITCSLYGKSAPNYGNTHTPETIEIIRKAALNRAPASEETRRKISKIHKGKITTTEAKKKMSDASAGEKNGMYGRKHSPEVRKKMSAKANLRTRDKQGKFIITL